MEYKNREITVTYINSLSYPDFVGFINQWNVLPGSYNTLNKWRVFGRVDEDSRLLQVACTTGFQSRELAVLTGCSGVAFDLSELAVDRANYNKHHYAPHIDMEYIVMDGYEYTPEDKFTHVVVGAGLQFFSDPNKMFEKCIDFIEDEGYLLASPFYVKSKIPNDLVEKAKTVFGITPTLKPYKEIMSIYNKLEIIYEDKNDIVEESLEEIDYYCKCTTKRGCEMLGTRDSDIYKAIYDRLHKIKVMSNELRPYQQYSVLVLRYRKKTYPNRYVELF